MSKSHFQWPVIGHQGIVSYLWHALETSGLAHAYIFYGPESVGKRTTAESLLLSLYCQDAGRSGVIPCGTCQSCEQIKGRVHPDVAWVSRATASEDEEEKKNISIDQVRALRERLSLRSFFDGYKVALIDQAESLSLEAANALLKLLEEPTPKTVLILITTSLEALPKTIVSRCQRLQFLPVGRSVVADWLLDQGADQKMARTLAAVSAGRPGVAQYFFENQEAFAEYQEGVADFLSLHRLSLAERFRAYSIGSRASGAAADGMLELWQTVIRDILLFKIESPGLMRNSIDQAELAALAGQYSQKQLIELSDALDVARRDLASNVNGRLVLENILLQLPSFR